MVQLCGQFEVAFSYSVLLSFFASPAGADQLGSSRGRGGARETGVRRVGHDASGGGAAAAGSCCEARPEAGFASGAGCDGGVCAAHCTAEKNYTGEIERAEMLK